MEHIIVGKHTLESLTSGMYSDPFVVYREYIQNSTDSIDECIKEGIIKETEGRISVSVSPSEKRIVISDNGKGIPEISAEKTLISIGNSKKTADNSRGFRGIGRLSALSYCGSLTFETSSYGEELGTRIFIDADRLAQLLAADDEIDITVIDVLKSVYVVETYTERRENHYFNVILENVDPASKLLDVETVISYLSQNAPVPYSPNAFVWGKEIKRRISKVGYSITEYNISVFFGNESIPIYKPYADSFLVDKGKNLQDSINDIQIIAIEDNDKKTMAIGWIGKTNYRGSIYDKSVKGIRLRKGNILIGDSQSLNTVFKDARFNGWSIGEVFIVDSQLIPNARRDGFEKNAAYFKLFENLTTIAAGIVKDIRAASLARNAELANVIAQTEVVAASTVSAISDGVSSTKKGTLKQNLSRAKTALDKLNPSDTKEEYIKGIAFDELDMLIGKVQGATAFKALNTLENLSKTEKRILEKVFNVIVSSRQNDTEKLIDLILEAFSK